MSKEILENSITLEKELADILGKQTQLEKYYPTAYRFLLKVKPFIEDVKAEQFELTKQK